MSENLYVTARDTTDFIVDLYVGWDVPEPNARLVTDHLVDSSLAGLHSHGVMRAPDYLDHADTGLLDPTATPEVVRDDGAVVLLDARRGFGQVAGVRAADEAASCARRNGIALVTVSRAAHLGRIGAYVERLAREGLLALAFCSVPTRYHNVAWFGAREARLGTNPIAYAFPTEGEPVVADFSTSAIPEGKVRFLRNQGLPAPPGVLRDAAGTPTTDPNVLYGEPPGTLQPLGGDLGHKGSAMGMLVEAMATLLAGERADDQRRANNLTVVALRPASEFRALGEGLVAHVHAAAPVDPDRPPLVPGEPEHRARAAASHVLFDATTWARLTTRAHGRGVPMPSPTRSLST